MLLRTLVAVIDRAEKRWVKARQPREILGVHFVVLVAIFINQSQLARVRHNDFRTEFYQ